MGSINPYLNFMGNTEEAFTFYKSVLGGEFKALQRFKDLPGGDSMPEQEQDKIMHISLPVGNGNFLMASDALESMGHSLTKGNNTYISLQADSEAEADRIFNGLSAGGEIEMPLEKTFWGAYFGSFTDKFGVQWMVSFDYGEQQ